MSVQLQKRLEDLRSDHESVTGSPFEHFLCPILFRDDDTELCRAHVINKSFQESDRSWTVQRADVDAWYGTMFEADFLAVEKRDKPIIEEAFFDSDLGRRFRPMLRVDGEEVPYYFRSGPVPESHTGVQLEVQGKSIQLGLKITQDEILTSLSGKWEFEIEKDLRVPTLASVLKAAHLTMFHLLGYRYALSAGGIFLGKDVLGEIFTKANGMERGPVLKLAEDHFRNFVNMVRPVVNPSPEFNGTLTDMLVHFFILGQQVWACQVLIRNGDQRHAVVVPILEDGHAAAQFCRFLDSPSMKVEVRTGQINRDHIKLSPTSESIEWPEASFDVP